MWHNWEVATVSVCLGSAAWLVRLVVRSRRRPGRQQASLGTMQQVKEHKRQQRQRQQQQRQAGSPPATAQGSTSSPHSSRSSSSSGTATSIPQHELKALQGFLRRVYGWRGWQGGHYHLTLAWHTVEEAAATPAGGAWQQQFTGKQLTGANCDALLRLIDLQFCNGKLLKRLWPAGRAANDTDADQCGRCPPPCMHSSSGSDSGLSLGAAAAGVGAPGDAGGGAGAGKAQASSKVGRSKLHCRVVQNFEAGWLAYFDTDDNVIYLNCWRWAKEVSADSPVNCEGVVCCNRLQLLLHTLAHELVHAVVFHLFPEMDKCSPAYLANDRHGPVFQLLNKQLFGHSSDALERVCLHPSRV